MNPFRWMAEKLGLVQSAEDAFVVDALTKLRVVGAVSRAHTRHQVETYLADLEAAGHAALATAVREELAAGGLLPAAQPLAVSVVPALPPAEPLALPAAPPAAPQAPEKRKPGRPRKVQPSAPAESFPADPH